MYRHTAERKALRCAPDQLSVRFDLPEGPYLHYLRFAFRRIGNNRDGGGKDVDRLKFGGLIRAVQSSVCPEPFVVMCHTPTRQTAS